MPEEISADFPFESKYIEVLGSKIHYIEEGKGDPILFLHGNPTSSYLWRNIIPHLESLGRCLAPDLIGMGKSDKPDISYRFSDHLKYIEGFIAALKLTNITFVIHDWGSGIGFQYAYEHESNTKGLAFMESMIKPFTWDDWPGEAGKLFKAFRTPELGENLLLKKNLFVENVLPGSVVRGLTEAEMEHYRAPFPDPESRKPILIWPRELSIDGEPEDMTRIIATYSKWLTETDLPKLMLYAQPGAINREDTVDWCLANMKNLTTGDVGPGSHFIQEDSPHLIGEKIAEWYKGL